MIHDRNVDIALAQIERRVEELRAAVGEDIRIEPMKDRPQLLEGVLQRSPLRCQFEQFFSPAHCGEK